MLKSSKSMISSSTHDQLSKVINKTQNRYQHHHHYYHNDLIYRCNKKTKRSKRHKRKKRNKNRNRRNKKKLKTNKHLNNIENSIKNYTGISINGSIDGSSGSSNATSISEPKNVCYCSNYAHCCKVNLKISYEINSYLKHICVYFENNLKLVLVIILLALITCTAQRIDDQVEPQQKPFSTTSPTLLAVLNNAASIATINLKKPLLQSTTTCHHYVPNFPLRRDKKAEEGNYKFHTQICHNPTHTIHQLYLKGQTHKNFKNLYPYNNNRNSSKWLANRMPKRFKTNVYNQQIAVQIHYQLDNNNNYYHDDDDDDGHHRHNDPALVINKSQQNYKNKKTEIQIKNMAKEADEQQQQHLREINNSNINKFFQHIRNINKKHLRNTNYKTNYNNITNEKKTIIDENVNDNAIINHVHKHKSGHQRDGDDDHDNNYDNDEIDNFEMSLNLLPTTNHMELMKLVMRGLGIKNVPKIEMVNISQEEYVTKYREYLHRVHMRKRRELEDVIGEHDKTFLKPLEILTIVSNSTLLSHYPEYEKPYNENVLVRRKRNSFGLGLSNDTEKHEDQNEHYGGGNQSLEERVRNILFFKKHPKPRSTKRERDERKTNIRLMFALKPEILNLNSSDIEEANIRLVLIYSPILAIRNSKSKKTHTKSKGNSCGPSKPEGPKNLHQVNVLNLKLFFMPKHGKRVLLDGRKVDIHVDRTKPDETHNQWLQFDVSKAVQMSIEEKRVQHHIVLELQCDNCKRVGARILNDAYDTAGDALAHEPLAEGHQLMPVLNIIGHFDKTQRTIRPHKYEESHHSDPNKETTTQRHYHHQTYNYNNKSRHNRRNNCYETNQRCCRHSMEVTFKEIKGFEFIIQPKVFDAGYCHGRCPPRYNPAHHHALLQSLIWKQNHHKAPRPCCAPSKLVELEVLHVDEKDSEKLKISTWSDMKVVECACS